MPIAAGGDAFGDVVAAWGTPEILGRLEAMRMLLMQADRRVAPAIIFAVSRRRRTSSVSDLILNSTRTLMRTGCFHRVLSLFNSYGRP